ncbi:unnamed protein product [Ixodes pacificus]
MRTIVLFAVIALGGLSLIMGDANHSHPYGVSFDSGSTFTYRNMTIRGGYSEPFQLPCEYWSCNVTARTLSIEGCNVPRYGSCLYAHNSRFYWPLCCRMSRLC